MNTESSAKAIHAKDVLEKDGQKQDDLADTPGGEIGRLMTSYVGRVGSLHTALRLSSEALVSYGKAKLREMQQYVVTLTEMQQSAEKQISEASGGKQRVRQPHPEDHLKALGGLRVAATHVVEAQKLVPRSLFVSMVSEYESLLAKLLTAMFNLKPEMCIQFKKPIDVKKALEFQSIEAMHAYIIGTEVDDVMWKSTAEQLEYFAKTMHAIDVGACDGVTDVYEVSLRRNLYVHCDGVVGQPYLNGCMGRLRGESPGADCCLLRQGGGAATSTWVGDCCFALVERLSQEPRQDRCFLQPIHYARPASRQ